MVLEPTKHSFVGEFEYIIHPAALDTCLQLGLVASNSGQVEDMRHVYVPIAVDEMSFWVQQPARAANQAIAVSHKQELRSIDSYIQLFNELGNPLLQIDNLRCTLCNSVRDQQMIAKYPRSPYCRLRWKPDIGSLSN